MTDNGGAEAAGDYEYTPPPMSQLRKEYVEMRAEHYGFSDLYAQEWDRALTAHDAEIKAEGEHTLPSAGRRRSARIAAVCGYTVTDRDGTERPCDRPATSWRWYQEQENEDLLEAACSIHENTGGQRMHAAEAEVERLRTHIARNGIQWCSCSRADRMHERRIPRCPYHGDGMAMQRNLAEQDLDEARAERDRAEAALARVRELVEEWQRRCEHYRGTGNWIAMRGVTDGFYAALTEETK